MLAHVIVLTFIIVSVIQRPTKNDNGQTDDWRIFHKHSTCCRRQIVWQTTCHFSDSDT